MQHCLEVDADGGCTLYDHTVGYFTWGPGNNTASIILAWLAIIVSVVAAVLVTLREDNVLNAAADRLADKYNSED
jgi:hypothetical protein